MAKVEMTHLNSSGTYETIYPKVGLSNITGTLPVANGGAGTTSLDSLMTNMGRLVFRQVLTLEQALMERLTRAV